MKTINAVNINDAWVDARNLLYAVHTTRPSRVGQVWEYPTPVTTVYTRPLERVLFDPQRNANPFFHLMEALHLLAGRRDVSWLEQFNSRIREFVGPDEEQHGAYGWRLRKAFDLDGGAEDDYADQLLKAIRMLKASPNERRAVIANWNPLWDLERPELADIPCNTHAYLKIRDGKLDIVVCCRSNDIIYGCYGSNIVQFSVLLEYLAAMIGVPVGTYYQMSDSWHAYTERWDKLAGNPPYTLYDFYGDAPPGSSAVEPYRMVEDPERFDKELQHWMERKLYRDKDWRNRFFPDVAEPLWQAWACYKRGVLDEACFNVLRCEASDWALACTLWLKRIIQKRKGA
jgi:hypothetical protein